jgi:uncharacterized membrane protein
MQAIEQLRPGRVTDALASARPRLDSIDVLRGLIMVIMALDHVRDFFSSATVMPTDLTQTTPALFFTRWITHFCAPVFVFLAGTSAFLYGARGRSKAELSRFLWTRGLWLVVLEFTLVNWGWQFDLTYPRAALQVIWALGSSMIIMAGLVRLPIRWMIGLGLALIAGHHLFDSTHFAPGDWRSLPWALLHDCPRNFEFGHRINVFVLYPIIPWVGVMAAGYGFGQIYLLPSAERQRWISRLGAGLVVGFVALRLLNIYGDPAPWSAQKTALFTFMSFLNCTKYPPSLLYLLMTLGPALCLLSLLDRWPGWRPNWLLTFGRVPLFYYLLHLYLIHLSAGIAALLFGRMADGWWIFGHHFALHRPENYGFSLWGVYLAWIIIVALLYWPCRWYAGVKQRNRSPWLSYL